MSKRYFNAVKALYGNEPLPATYALAKARSCSTMQPRKPRRNIERGLQVRLVAWASGQGLDIIMIGNEGKRTRIGGHIAKQMGLRPGASDLFLAHCANGYGGYWIELKRPGETPRENQAQFLDQMRRNGYKAEWFDDWECARDSIMEYMTHGRI